MGRSLRWPDPRVKPPFRAAEIDWGHALARGLAACVLANEGAGLTQDLVSGRGLLPHGGPAWADGQDQVALQTDGSDDYWQAVGLFPSISVPVTLECRYAISPSSVVFNNVALSEMFCMLRSTSSIFEAFALVIENTGSTVAKLRAGTLDDTTGSFAFATGATNLWTASRDTFFSYGGVFSANNARAAYLNGRQDATNSTSKNAQVNDLLLGCGTSSGSLGFFATGRIDCAVIYSRALSADEMLWRSLEPYAMLRPIMRRRHFVPLAAAGVTYPQLERQIRGMHRGVLLGAA